MIFFRFLFGEGRGMVGCLDERMIDERDANLE
jgi:hypothetical protein